MSSGIIGAAEREIYIYLYIFFFFFFFFDRKTVNFIKKIMKCKIHHREEFVLYICYSLFTRF